VSNLDIVESFEVYPVAHRSLMPRKKQSCYYFMVTKNSNKKLHLTTDCSGTFVTFRNGRQPNRKRDRRKVCGVLHS
jgi:hypothetical protein